MKLLPRLNLSGALAHLVVHRPTLVLLVGAVLAALATPLILRVRLDTDPVSLIPQHNAESTAFARFVRVFSEEQLALILVECDDPTRLTTFAEAYAARLRAQPDIAEVRVRLSGSAAKLVEEHLLDLLDDAELEQLAARTDSASLARQARRLRSLLTAPGGSSMAPLLTADPLELLSLIGKRLQAGLPVDPGSGYYRSADGKALLLFVRPRFAPSEIEHDRALIADSTRIARELGAHVDDDGSMKLETSGQPRVGFTGPYAYTVAYRDWLHRDTQVSTTVSAIAVLLFFALLLGAVRALPIVAVPLLLGLWFTGAAAGGLYGRVNAVSLAFGTILLSIGIDLPIQIYNRLREELHAASFATRPSPTIAIERTIASLAGPALLATLGPAAVFFACRLSEYKGLAELGVLAGVGLIINLVAMLTILPAMLALVPARLWMPVGPPSTGTGFAWLGRQAARRPLLVLGLVAASALALAPAALKLRVERKLISIEPPGMPPARVEHELQARFGGHDNLLVVLSDGATREEALAKSDRWRARAEALREQGVLAGFESISSLFPSRAEVDRRRARIDRLDRARVARELEAALVDTGFDVAPFAPFLDRLRRPLAPLTVDDAGSELSFLVQAHLKSTDTGTLVTTYLYPPNGQLDEALGPLRKLVAEAPDDGQLSGKPILEESLRRVVERDTKRVTAAAVIAVALILALYYRRLRPTLAVLLPLGVAWLLFAAVLGGAGIPLNLFNLLAVPLVVGYGIDDHVFLVHRFEEDPDAGPGRALASTGRAIVVTSLSTMAGFAGLAAARFDGLRLLGVSGALAVALCLLAAFAVLPALLAVLYRRR